MANWREMSLDNFEAAKELLASGRWRSSVSRSYYAAYCAITEDLDRRNVSFAHGWNNPGHEQLLLLIRHNLILPENSRRQLRRALHRLRIAREDADYRPTTLVDRHMALTCIRDAALVLDIMGETNA
jgi:uncharacterized protein (UPF0332 family)